MENKYKYKICLFKNGVIEEVYEFTEKEEHKARECAANHFHNYNYATVVYIDDVEMPYLYLLKFCKMERGYFVR